MTEPLQVGQFAIVDGEPVDRGPNAGVFHGKGPADDRAELFILAEGTTPAGEAFAGHVVSALGSAFATLDMSLTGSLTRLFHEAERNLADWNRKSIAQHRVAVGLSAFGRRGDQAVIAQAGPTAAFHLHDRDLRAYFADGKHAAAIGSAPVQPQLTRIPFEPGDRLLLISSHAVRELDDELISGILALPEEQILPDLYRRVQQLRQVTVVLVTGSSPERSRRYDDAEEVDESVIIDATLGAPSDGSFQPSLFIQDESEEMVLSARAHLMEVTPRAIETFVPVMAAEAPAPLLRASGESATMINRLAAEGAARAARSRAAVATIEAEAPRFSRPSWRTPGEGPVAHTPSNGNGSHGDASSAAVRPRKNHSFSRGLVTSGPPPARPEMLGEDLPLVAELAAGRRARATGAHLADTLASESGTAMSGGAPLVRPRSNMGGRWKGGNSFGSRTSLGSQLPPTWMVIMGVLSVLVVVAGILTVPRMLENDTSERLSTLLQGAQQRIDASSTRSDATEKRLLLSEAQAMLLEARELAPSPDTDQLIANVAGAITQMDNVRQPQAVETIASLEQFGVKPVAVARMVMSEQAAYLLDVNGSQVVSVPLGGGEPRVVFAENKDEMRAKPIAIAYLEQSSLGGPALLIADSASHLYAYSASDGLRAIAFAAPAKLAANDIAVKGTELFVLDASAATVYRYAPTSAGFPNAPAKALSSPDLAQARRLMVDDEFLTVDAGGTIHRFINGGSTAITFSQAGIDELLVVPETPYALEDGGELAILDAANDRVVVLRRDGGFDRQYRHADFVGASAFAMYHGEAYLFSGAQLRRVIF